MARPAVPRYLGEDFTETPPGHRFTLYGAFWEADWQRVKNIAPADLKRDFGTLTPQVVKLRDALRNRQAQIAATLGRAVWTIEAQSIAPFVTGTGIEHPLENGMAFLNPYGLPYLPGSGVKGMVRRAAEELRDDVFGEGTQGWDQTAIDSLFGKQTESGDTDTEPTRGALTFWDVVPQCDRLAVDIMNPHYDAYYQGKTPPTDCGQPVPIFFLTVPTQTPLTFHIQCDCTRLPKGWPPEHWRTLLDTAVAHAFDWLGFGAKTAVGYGAMRRNLEQEQKNRQGAAQRQRQAVESALPAEQKALNELRRWFEEDQAAQRKEPGGRVVNRLNALLNEGPDWPKAEREALAMLAEAVYGYLDWGSGKKKQERKAKIQRLREEEST